MPSAMAGMDSPGVLPWLDLPVDRRPPIRARAFAIDETGSILEPAPTSAETTRPAYADTTSRR
jgi:hypothetical protein